MKDYKNREYTALFFENPNGYIVTFKDGAKVKTKITSGFFGSKKLEVINDSHLTLEQKNLLYSFVKEINTAL